MTNLEAILRTPVLLPVPEDIMRSFSCLMNDTVKIWSSMGKTLN